MPAAAVVQTEDKYPPFTDKYDVERVIGRGGMGTVFEAIHTRLGQRVAIKVLGDDLRMHPELVRRFEREARAASALSSPHAVRVFDIDQTEDGTPFFVMELLSGRDLNDIVTNDGPQPVGVAVRWIIEASDAIAEAHRLGIIHRDIKPSNLLLCEKSGMIKVLDFGIAKRNTPNERAITLGVQPLGTPQYMSPEQVRCAKDVDARTDIWSLGVTLYELVTGRPPFNHDLSAACIASIAADPVPDPREFNAELPDAVAKVIMRALEKDPKERFQTVDEMVLALAPFGEQITPETPSWRVISTMRKACAKQQATLDGEHAPDSGESLEDSVVRPRRTIPISFPSAPSSSSSPSLGADDTVPPMVAHLALPMHGKRFRGAVALVGAALLGLAAFVVTPHWLSSNIDAQQAKAATATVSALVPAEVVVEPAAATELPAEPLGPIGPPAPDAPASTTTTDVAPAQPAPVASDNLAAHELPKDVAPAASARLTFPRPRGTIRVVGSDRPVHGGISNPGF